jgi:hypothetical protein
MSMECPRNCSVPPWLAQTLAINSQTSASQNLLGCSPLLPSPILTFQLCFVSGAWAIDVKTLSWDHGVVCIALTVLLPNSRVCSAPDSSPSAAIWSIPTLVPAR